MRFGGQPTAFSLMDDLDVKRLKWELTFSWKCGIILVSRGGGNTKRSMRQHRANNSEKIFEKLFKNPLTKPQKCGIIYM